MNKQKILKVILNTLAPPPNIVEGIIATAVKDKPTKEAVDWLATNNIWETLPDKHKKMFITYCPDLGWFNYDWVVQTIGKYNVPLASRIMGSPSLQAKVKEQIEAVKAQLAL